MNDWLSSIEVIDITKDILFLPLDLPRIDISYDRLLHVYNKYATADNYRNCRHIAIYTSLGSALPGNFSKNNLSWTSVAKEYFPELICYIKENIDPWMSPLGRVAIICTLPGEENPPHIDCDRDSFAQLQLKFRVVLHGNTEDLEFLTSDGSVKAPVVKNPFLMAGEWPHKMKNSSGRIKFTLAIGSPWGNEMEENSNFEILLRNSLRKNFSLLKKSFRIEEDYEKYFFN